MLFNYHTHTARCNHAKGTDREYVEAAIRAGIKVLGFSDHAPYVFPKETGYYSSFRMKVEEAEDYVSSVLSLKKEYEKEVEILCGFELEYYPDYHKDEMAFLRQYKPDYLILGQHCLGNEVSGLLGRGSDDILLTAYVTQVLAGLATGDFLYLAHPDMCGYRYSEEWMQKEYRRLCEGAKRMNVPLEINLLGVRENRWYPDGRFFKIAAEVGNEVLLGVDAHSPESLENSGEEKARELAKEWGIALRETPLVLPRL